MSQRRASARNIKKLYLLLVRDVVVIPLRVEGSANHLVALEGVGPPGHAGIMSMLAPISFFSLLSEWQCLFLLHESVAKRIFPVLAAFLKKKKKQRPKEQMQRAVKATSAMLFRIFSPFTSVISKNEQATKADARENQPANRCWVFGTNKKKGHGATSLDFVFFHARKANRLFFSTAWRHTGYRRLVNPL